MAKTIGDPRGFWSPFRLALALGASAGLAVVLTLADPGITADEPLDVRPGRTYVETLLKRGLGFFDRRTVDLVFRDNAEHPPLGRWLLGVASVLGQPFESFFLGGPDPLGLYLHAARLAPASVFAALVALVAYSSAKRHGTAAGFGSGFSLAVMPRVFGHAHFGALDTFVTFFWVLALLAADRALTSRRPLLGMALAGMFWSLALLTKIHAWFLIPILLVWSVVRRGPKVGPSLFGVWLVAGLGVFVAGWPWLWFDPVGRLTAYLGTGVARATIRVTYFGQVYADRDVPWHYPWVYFVATVPVGIHLLGAVGLVTAWKSRQFDRSPWLPLSAIVTWLTVFSTRVPVYDGERLFLMVFPLWALFAGAGFASLWVRVWGRIWGRGLLVTFLLFQAYGVTTLHPFQLSYYNALVGGLRGAETLGLELTFWGDAVDRVLLRELVNRVPGGAEVALAPSLYPGQGMLSTTRSMARRSLILGDESTISPAGWVVVSRRTAYWKPEILRRVASQVPVLSRHRQGVWLSAVFGPESVPATSSASLQAPTPNTQASPSQSLDDL